MGYQVSSDQAVVPCRGCGKSVVVPAGPVRAAWRLQEEWFTFCSRRCEMKSNAELGEKQRRKRLDQLVDASRQERS